MCPLPEKARSDLRPHVVLIPLQQVVASTSASRPSQSLLPPAVLLKQVLSGEEW